MLLCSFLCLPDCWQQSEAQWNGSLGAACVVSTWIIPLVLSAFPRGTLLSTTGWVEGCRKGMWKQQITLAEGRAPLSWQRDSELLRIIYFFIVNCHIWAAPILVWSNMQSLWFNYPEHWLDIQIWLLFICSLIALSYTQHKVHTCRDGKMLCVWMYTCR